MVNSPRSPPPPTADSITASQAYRWASVHARPVQNRVLKRIPNASRALALAKAVRANSPTVRTSSYPANWSYPVQMSTGSEVATAVAAAHPRRAVIDQAWRAIGPGVEVLSGEDGGP